MVERTSVDNSASLAPASAGGESLRTRDFDYPLDERLIAQRPLPDRDASRLLHVRRQEKNFVDRTFRDLASLISPGDVLVLNDTRVFPARLIGQKPSGAGAEVLLIERLDAAGSRWRALVRPGAKLKPGRVVEVAPDLKVVIEETVEGGMRLVRLDSGLAPDQAIARYGHVPLPPYIRRPDDEADRSRYQTVYARQRGSVAAPTAGLHFSDSLLAAIEARGVEIATVTLHVGPGTFRPVEVEDPGRHQLDAEWYRVTPQAAETINRARARGGAIWAVGTTTVRTLETAVGADGRLAPGAGTTDLFVRPGYRFRSVDRLVTNFHLPRSTLLMLVAGFAGLDLTMAAYRHAAEAGYRFYSYGDAMAVT
ncbi:MAG: tRNA preQ1(34) S-adenosylmethionine ribosyltransferase-isomerase QueA [Gemmatimonadales bacterium]|jgi:S-adenosylmethionine:tRNA ribosyltransferase-isomerase